MPSKFRIVGQLGRAGGPREGTVLIDRKAGTFTVRPHRSRRTFTVALSLVAEIIVERVIKAELRMTAKDKKKKRNK